MTRKPRTNVEKPNAKNIEKSCSYSQNENVPPAFKQYKTQGNPSTISLWISTLKKLESGIAPLVPRGFDPVGSEPGTPLSRGGVGLETHRTTKRVRRKSRSIWLKLRPGTAILLLWGEGGGNPEKLKKVRVDLTGHTYDGRCKRLVNDVIHHTRPCICCS